MATFPAPVEAMRWALVTKLAMAALARVIAEGVPSSWEAAASAAASAAAWDSERTIIARVASMARPTIPNVTAAISATYTATPPRRSRAQDRRRLRSASEVFRLATAHPQFDTEEVVVGDGASGRVRPFW